MGTLVIRVREDINAEYEILNSEILDKLLKILNFSAKSKEKTDWKRLKGKYKGKLSTVDDFIRHKQEEKSLEL